MRAAFVASCLRGALPPVLLRAVCLVRAIVLGVVLLYVECCCVLAESRWRIDRPRRRVESAGMAETIHHA